MTIIIIIIIIVIIIITIVIIIIIIIYEELGLTAQNLQDQAARTEKNSRQCNTEDGW